MGKTIQIAIVALFVVLVAACANTDNKWPEKAATTSESENAANSDSKWPTEQPQAAGTKKSSSYWTEENRY